MLNAFQNDLCCGDDLSTALESGELDSAESWCHEACGAIWQPQMVGPVRYWTPTEIIEIWR